MISFNKIRNIISLGVALLPFVVSGQAYISTRTNHQIDSLLHSNSQKELTVTERMKQFSRMFMEMPYSWTATGEGPDALYEPYPLVNFDSTNCMVYCEHVLAMAISDSWDNFFNNLQQIRYQNGIIGMRTRNHYTLGDWLSENSWLLNHISKQVVGDKTKSVTRTISHNQFYKSKGIADLRYVKDDYTQTIDYIPSANAGKVEGKIKDGDIGVLIFSRKDNIFAAHMVMFYHENDQLFVREASSRMNKVIQRPYSEWSKKLAANKYRAGFCLLRVKEDLNTAGKVILPWEIVGLK